MLTEHGSSAMGQVYFFLCYSGRSPVCHSARTGVFKSTIILTILLWPLMAWDLFKKPLSDLYCCDKLPESIDFKRGMFSLSLAFRDMLP